MPTMIDRAKLAGVALAGCLGALGAGGAQAPQADGPPLFPVAEEGGGAQARQGNVALVYRLLQEGRMLVIPRGGQGGPAQIGQRLHNGDQLATSENTRAALRFTDDGSILRVNPSSRVRLTSGDERGVVVRTLE